MVRLLADPPNTTFVPGMRVGFDEVADSVNKVAGVPESAIVNGIATGTASSRTVRLVNPVIVGSALAVARTLTTKVRVNVLLVVWPSSTVTVIIEVPVVLLGGRNVSVPVVFGLV